MLSRFGGSLTRLVAFIFIYLLRCCRCCCLVEISYSFSLSGRLRRLRCRQKRDIAPTSFTEIRGADERASEREKKPMEIVRAVCVRLELVLSLFFPFSFYLSGTIYPSRGGGRGVGLGAATKELLGSRRRVARGGASVSSLAIGRRRQSGERIGWPANSRWPPL